RLPYNDRLIELVRSFPCLYNQDKRVFVVSKERNIIWERIASSIDPLTSGEFAKRRWLQIRDRYRKELRAALKGELLMGTRWKHFGRLAWLDPHLKNLDLQRSDDDGSGDQSTESSSHQSTSSPQEYNLNTDFKLESLLQNNESEENGDSLGYLNLTLFHSLLNESPSDLANDEFFLFARIIGLRLKRMQSNECRRIQSAIMQLLDEEEKK
ncbi:hypothetical protein PMAYCL1PPCAC_06777, partial [Pristionchus mayeri]